MDIDHIYLVLPNEPNAEGSCAFTTMQEAGRYQETLQVPSYIRSVPLYKTSPRYLTLYHYTATIDSEGTYMMDAENLLILPHLLPHDGKVHLTLETFSGRYPIRLVGTGADGGAVASTITTILPAFVEALKRKDAPPTHLVDEVL